MSEELGPRAQGKGPRACGRWEVVGGTVYVQQASPSKRRRQNDMKPTRPADKNMLEAEEGLAPDSGEVYPDAVVKISRDQYSAFEIKRMAEETNELVIAPPFQRNLVWKKEQQRELIESILMGIPIPVVYVFEDENGKKQVVDGRQRISTIISFLNDEFSLENLKMLPAFNGKKFSELEPIYKSKVERYQIPVYVIEPPTPERVKYDIFDRVNRGGTQLNNQEMRNALYVGQATKLLAELSKSKPFKGATGNGIKSTRMRDQYVILRFLAFYLLRTHRLDFRYKSNIDDLLAETMKRINGVQKDEAEALKDVFQMAMQRSYKVLGAGGFRFAPTNVNRRPVNMALFEVIAYFFAVTDTEPCDPEKLKARLDELKNTFDQSGYFSSRVDSSSSVEYRFGEVEKLSRELEC